MTTSNMKKTAQSAEGLLDLLGELSRHLTNVPHQDHSYFEKPLQIINQALGFHVSVLYKISNVIENDLILEVLTVINPEYVRSDLVAGSKISLNLNQPRPEFVNEVLAFKNRSVSAINVPGWGCDIAGLIYAPENMGHGYLLAGDFWGEESDTQAYEVHACEIMCNMLSAVLMKTQFEKLASYDGLTGLLNSRAIREELEKAFQRQKRKNSGLGAVVLTDIDFFKKINDNYGHMQGDSVLQEVGQIFDEMVRKHLDQVGRYGGEEFLLIYEESEQAPILNVVERLRQAVDQHQFKKVGANGNTVEGEFLHVTMSFGVALFDPQSMQSSKEILAAADAALYKSKENGRNCVTLAGS